MRIASSAMFCLSLFLLVGCSSKFAESETLDSNTEGTKPGDCTDGADNDADSLFDCDDSGCAGSPFCTDEDGGSSGGTSGGSTDGGGSGSGTGGGTGSGSGSGGSGGGDTGPIDVDGDGSPAIDDCDDNNAAVNPSATEVCDGIDNDCSGAADDNPVDGTMYYPDHDADGYGDTEAGVMLCAPSTGFVVIDGDCDDDEPLVFPGVAESCDGVDQDCNGEIDEGLETTMYFADSDGDGYGDPDASVEACREPDDHVENAEDCDDERYIVNPEGTEISWSGIDEDCDGYDLDFLECAEDTVDDSLAYLEGWTYFVDDISGSVYDPFVGFFPIGSYSLTDGRFGIEGRDLLVTPTAEHDEFDISITIDFYMVSNLYADYELFEGATTCELESGPLAVNYSGTMEINPHEDEATSTVHLDTTVLADPSAVTSFDGCNLDLIDALFSLADVDFSPTEMVDTSLIAVADEFERILEEDLEIQTPLTCRP